MKRQVLLILLAASCAQVQRSQDAASSPLHLSERSCGVHGQQLEICTVDVSYGLPMMPERSYAAARQVFFPHSTDAPNGGCVPRGGTAEIEVCGSCDRAEAEWLSQHARFAGNLTPCRVHDAVLVEGEIRLLYGMYGLPTSRYQAAVIDHFPHANIDYVMGSCEGSGGTYALPVRFCPACRTAEQDWRSENSRFTSRL